MDPPSEKLSERERLEIQIELYIFENNFFDFHAGPPKFLETVKRHSTGNPAEDLSFATDLIRSGQGSKFILGKERLEAVLTFAPVFGYTRTINDPEIKSKYERLMEIYDAENKH